jgi:hypothetical protein
LDSASELLAISKHVDGLIITVRAGITSKGSLLDLISSLRTANAPISGVVFNGVVPGSVGTGYRYGYGYGYGKGYGYGSYASRYSAEGTSGKLKKRRKHHIRGRSNGWYRKMYKRDLKNRGKISPEQFDAVLAFGPDSAYQTITDWVEAERGSANTHPKETKQMEVPVAKQEEPQKSATPVKEDLLCLSDIENDIDAVGKKIEE